MRHTLTRIRDNNLSSFCNPSSMFPLWQMERMHFWPKTLSPVSSSVTFLYRVFSKMTEMEKNLFPIFSPVTFLHCVFPPVTDHFPPWRRRAISVKSVAQCDVQIKCIWVVQQQCNLMLQICQIGLPMSAFVSENLLCSDVGTFCHRTGDVFRWGTVWCRVCIVD